MKSLRFVLVLALALLSGALLSTRAQTPAPPPPPAPLQPQMPTEVQARPAQPGAINYIEGEATIDGRPIAADIVGTRELGRGQTLATTNGRAEILLTPGVFLRLDNNSAVKMIDSRLEHTEVEINSGRAMVEVDDIYKENDVQIDEDGSHVQLLKDGLYEFDASHSRVRVFDGQAEIASAAGKPLKLGKEHEVTLTGNPAREANKFDTRDDEDDFFRWSALRSGYLSEATADQARLYVDGGPAWLGTGWYWDPWFDAYTFIPGDGVFFSPFGWGYYSPYALYRSPYYYGHFGRPHRFGEFHYPVGHGIVPPGAFRGGGFHGDGAARGAVRRAPAAGGRRR